MSTMPAVGLPVDAPDRPADKIPFPAVHSMPPPRAAALLNDAEQNRLEAELVAARERNNLMGGVTPARKKPAAPAAPPAVSPRARPPASNETIY